MAVARQKKKTAPSAATTPSANAIILCPEMFDLAPQIKEGNVHKKRVPFSNALQIAWTRMDKMQQTDPDQSTVLLFFDGRNRKIRRPLEDWFDVAFPDSNKTAELWLTYKLDDAGDVRTPKRRLAFSASNTEVMLVAFPAFKIHMKSKNRHGFAAGKAEGTTHSVTYSNVPVRPLGALPRLSKKDKEKMMGGELGAETGGPVDDELARGHPLFWQESKSIALFSALFHDFGITNVFDLSPGSGCAAIASVYNGIRYEGVCANPLHERWVQQILDKTTMAILCGDKLPQGLDADEAKKNASSIKHYFSSSIAEAKRFLKDQPDNQGAGQASADEDDDASEDA